MSMATIQGNNFRSKPPADGGVIGDNYYLENRKEEVRQTGNNMLGKDDFLKLLITQLQNQDPTNPMDDREFIAQMAQFSSLEQMQNMTKAMEALLMSQQQSQMMEYTNFIGKEVQWHEISTEKDDEGNFIVNEGKGVIQSVQFKDGEPVFKLADGKEIAVGNISGVLNNNTANESAIVRASALIGKTVTYKYTDENDEEKEAQAKVTSVSNKDGKITYILDNNEKITDSQFIGISA